MQYWKKEIPSKSVAMTVQSWAFILTKSRKSRQCDP